MTDLGVHVVCEVDRCGIGRQRDDLALGGEYVHLGGTEVVFEGAEELAGIRGLARPVGELLDPLQIVLLLEVPVPALEIGLIGGAQRTARLTVRLVFPMGGDAEFGAPVHVPRANLNLHRLAAGPITVVCRLWYMLSFGIAM